MQPLQYFPPGSNLVTGEQCRDFRDGARWTHAKEI